MIFLVLLMFNYFAYLSKMFGFVYVYIFIFLANTMFVVGKLINCAFAHNLVRITIFWKDWDNSRMIIVCCSPYTFHVIYVWVMRIVCCLHLCSIHTHVLCAYSCLWITGSSLSHLPIDDVTVFKQHLHGNCVQFGSVMTL